MNSFKEELDLLLSESITNNNQLIKQIKIFILQTMYPKRGQHLIWHLLHSFSVFYPDEPSDELKQNTKEFIIIFKKTLPFCSSCGNNGKDVFIQNYDIDLAVSNKNELITFFIKYHSYINENFTNNLNYNSSIFTLEYVINKYSDRKIIDYFNDKYNINLLQIINQKVSLEHLMNIMYGFREKIFIECKNIDYDLNFSIIIK